MPVTYILFGATGDLALKKIIPALAKTYLSGTDIKVLAFSRRDWTDSDYHSFIHYSLSSHHLTETEIKNFNSRVSYIQGSFDNPQSFVNLNSKIKTTNNTQIIIHLAIQPEYYAQTIEQLAFVNIINKNISAQLLIEKPFGHDTASAEALNNLLHKHISEENIFRIDHYLGKENIRAIASEVIRAEVENKLDAYHVSSITATLFEKEGIEGRGEFYEQNGVIRDVIQNHVLQMVATVLASPQQSRAAILSSLELIYGATPAETLVLGQYEGYKDEAGVSNNSEVATFAAFKIKANVPRWSGVPILIKAGKGLKESLVEVAITFKDESEIKFAIRGNNALGETHDAYEHLISEAIKKDQRFFASTEEILASWKLIDAVMSVAENVSTVQYPKHSNLFATISL